MPKRTKPNQTAPVELLENTEKSTAAEIEQRVNAVFGLLVNGAKRWQIIKFANADKQAWGVGERQIDTYIATATALIVEAAAANRTYELGRAKARLDTIFASTMTLQDYQRALSANDQYNKLLGLYPPQVHIINHLFEKAGLSVELVTDLLDALQSRGIAASEVFNSMLAELSKEDAAK